MQLTLELPKPSQSISCSSYRNGLLQHQCSISGASDCKSQPAYLHIILAISDKKILLRGEGHHIADLQMLLQLKQAAAYNHCCCKTLSFETDYIWTNKLPQTLTGASATQASCRIQSLLLQDAQL